MAELRVYAALWPALWTPQEQADALERLPVSLHDEVLRFGGAQERQGRTLARLLLREGLRERGQAGALAQWRRDERGRPFLAPSAACPVPPDVSCAHAPGLTVAALGWGCKVGIDAEPCGPAPSLAAYSAVFSPSELYFIESSPPLAHAFTTLWTRKEALLKLHGRGLTADPAQMNTLVPAWPLHALAIHSDYVCHAAADAPCAGTLTVMPPDFWRFPS